MILKFGSVGTCDAAATRTTAFFGSFNGFVFTVYGAYFFFAHAHGACQQRLTRLVALPERCFVVLITLPHINGLLWVYLQVPTRLTPRCLFSLVLRHHRPLPTRFPATFDTRTYARPPTRTVAHGTGGMADARTPAHTRTVGDLARDIMTDPNVTDDLSLTVEHRP